MKVIIAFLIMVIIASSIPTSMRLHAGQLEELEKENEILNQELDESYRIRTSQDVQLLVNAVELRNFRSQYFIGIHRDAWLTILMFFVSSYGYRTITEGVN